MNRIVKLFPVGFLVLLGACKKTDTATVNPALLNNHSPNFICEYQTGATAINGQFVVFDLNRDANADKQFFILSLLNSGGIPTDSCQVLQAPQPIESLAASWPATIKSVAFGVSNNILKRDHSAAD